MAKEAIEDCSRHSQDEAINNAQVDVWTYIENTDPLTGNRTGEKNWHFEQKAWMDVVDGEIVRLTEAKGAFPADILVLQTSVPNGVCNIETSNLDGETNLKSKQAVNYTYDVDAPADEVMGNRYPSRLQDLTLVGQPPSERIDKGGWSGVLSGVTPKQRFKSPVSMQQVLLRGCTMKNTAWAIGMVIFTGQDTKLMMNNKDFGFKRSKMDRQIDYALMRIFSIQMLAGIFGTAAQVWWKNHHAKNMWYDYIAIDETKPVGQQITHDLQTSVSHLVPSFMGFIVLVDLLVPISLYVSVEFCKLFQAWLINNDRSMYHEESDTAAIARTSTLNEELGQIGFIFSDKTGTLTRNIMEFMNGSVYGVRYGPKEPEAKITPALPVPKYSIGYNEKECHFGDHRLLRNAISKDRKASRKEDHYLTLLSTCHTCIPEYEADEREFVEVSFRSNGGELWNISKPTVADPNPRWKLTQEAEAFSIQFQKSVQQVDADIRIAVVEDDNDQQDPTQLVFHVHVPLTWPDDGPVQTADDVDEFIRVITNVAKDATSKVVTFVSTQHHMGFVEYQAESPDEKALVMLAKNCGYCCYDVTPKTIEIGDNGNGGPKWTIDGHSQFININGERFEFEVMLIIEFNSTRKRMSVIVRDPRFETDNIFLYMKGADNFIYDRLTKSEQQSKIWALTLQHLKSYASVGLRTLGTGYRQFSEDEYVQWYEGRYRPAMLLQGEAQEDAVTAAYADLECELQLIGCTAIEDRLQDKVPTTIRNIKCAGINLWVLTGDKVETAINIAKSCNLIQPSMNYETIDPDEAWPDDQAEAYTKKAFTDCYKGMQAPDNPITGLVVSGRALGFVFPIRERDKDTGKEIPPTKEMRAKEDVMMQKLLRIARKCKAVVCCRVSPLQKAQVVMLIKDNIPEIITLAIGDGANDVPMIKAAHVGIGISGQEGLQAAMNSDYSIGQFKFLQRLLFLHGAWSYVRLAKLILYSFYKNVVLGFSSLWFMFFSGFSGTLFYDDMSSSFYNMVFTAVPVLLVACFDQPYSEKMAMYVPSLYKNGHKDGSFNNSLFVSYVLEGLYHSLLVFYIPTHFMDSMMQPNGKVLGFWSVSETYYTALIVVVTFKVAYDTRSWIEIPLFNICGQPKYLKGRATTFVLLGSAGSWFLFTLLWCNVPISAGFANYPVFGVDVQIFPAFQFWTLQMLMLVMCMLPGTLFHFTRMRFYRLKTLEVIQHIMNDEIASQKFYIACEKYLAQAEEDIGKPVVELPEALKISVGNSYMSQGGRRYSGSGFAFSGGGTGLFKGSGETLKQAEYVRLKKGRKLSMDTMSLTTVSRKVSGRNVKDRQKRNRLGREAELTKAHLTTRGL